MNDRKIAKDTNVPSTDYISRQEAVDALRMDIDIIPYAKAREYARAVIETVYNRLENLPAAQPEWIPVTERLPEKAGKYLVTVKNGNVYAGTFDLYSGRFRCAATAWQPLPEPYQEGATDEADRR